MTSPFEAKLEILADPEALSHRVADWLLEMATAKDGIFAVNLSGGSTPRSSSMNVSPNRPIARLSPGRERTGSGATSDLCLTMMR